MELKPYQNKVLEDLKDYLRKLEETKNLKGAFFQFWKERVIPSDSLTGTGIDSYKNNVPGVPNICIKVPTAGGKTFIACNALNVIFNFIKTETKAVIWLVPSVTILEQTIKNLSNSSHPYRQKINTHFSGRAEVYTKDKLLQGANFNPATVEGNLSIIVLSFDTLRIKKKEDRKIYQENGQLASFTNYASNASSPMKDTDETALINVIRKLNPVVVVDESHNAETDLSLEMLKDINPSFILDLTATPRKNSNIISYVNAGELKQEHMVKLPVIVYNHHDKTDVIISAIQLQNKLEAIAVEEEKQTGKYIRPIVLFQAQPKNNEDSTTFAALKEKLIEMQIPEEQIKIKTATINEIKGIDLLAKDCPIRYIITINALKEGWDCPFAYILASLADKNSAVDVEQILGRILRQPYTINHNNDMLNISYVMTASNKFMDTLEKIVEGLNKAGFGSKDYKVAEIESLPEKEIHQEEFNFSEESTNNTDNSKEENNPADTIDVTRNIDSNVKFIEQVEKNTAALSAIYNETISVQSTEEPSSIPEELKDKVKMIYSNEKYRDRIIDLRLPQFYLKIDGGLGIFGNEEEVLFNKENLLNGFQLSKCDTIINFEQVTSDVYSVDIEKFKEDEYRVEYHKVDKRVQAKLEEYILSAPKEGRIRELTALMVKLIGDIWPITNSELEKYLNHIFEDFTSDQVRDCLSKQYVYKDKIKHKIDQLSTKYVEDLFNKNLDTNKIIVKNTYQIKVNQIPGDLYRYGIAKSLFSEEHRMNDFEKRVINEIASLDNVLCWTKNPEKKGFHINGYINHYPDFIIIMKSGKIIIVESKGDDRDNTDSITKIKLGRKWADKAGSNFKYFMVFDKNELDGAYTLEQGLNVIREL